MFDSEGCVAFTRYEGREAGILVLLSPTLDVLSHGAIEADFRKQKPLVHKIAKKLTEAEEICLRSAAGASVTASVEPGRTRIPSSPWTYM